MPRIRTQHVLKTLAGTLLPQQLRAPVGLGIFKLNSLRYRGNNVICPCCGGHFDRFVSRFADEDTARMCPRCLSLERQRLTWLYLTEQTPLFTARLRVLHVAPELWFNHALSRRPNLDYVSIDLDSPLAMQKMDITALDFAADTFDVILCGHVLEHVPEDRRALQEFLRVLKPGGWALLQSPVDYSRPTTYEDPSIVTPEERLKAFGQSDHVRLYGADYADRLRESGFDVQVIDYLAQLPPSTVQTRRLFTDERIYYCTKPA